MTENTPAGGSQVLHAPSATNELDMARATLRTATAGLPALRAAVVRDYETRRAARLALLHHLGSHPFDIREVHAILLPPGRLP
jgi:hypothetical protein